MYKAFRNHGGQRSNQPLPVSSYETLGRTDGIYLNRNVSVDCREVSGNVVQHYDCREMQSPTEARTRPSAFVAVVPAVGRVRETVFRVLSRPAACD
jgi:hypothetical protein